MRIIQILFCSFFFFSSFAQPKIDFYNQKTEKGINIYAINPEFCPVSAQITFNLSNLSPITGNQNTFVIPAKSTNFLVTELVKIDNNKGYKFSYKFKSNFGDITLQNFDSLYEYDLPFQKGDSFKLHQGYFGSFSHQNERALDFTMNEGTPITAARDGVVINVVDNYNIACPNKSCIQYNNYINIYHNDGSFANYAHLKFKGSKVNIGDSVKQGDIIALSGNTGFTSGPHLHFVCYLAGMDKRRSIDTYFKINNGEEAYILEEGNTYKKDY
ncbi:MAG: M23 family metallopeptidase [Chitinophagaceae bacterium]